VALCLLAALLTLPSSAQAQGTFTLQASPFSPDAVAPTGTSSSVIAVGSDGGFSGTVNLGCVVSPTNLTDTPACTVSPATVTPPTTASVTITTQSLTSTVAYSFTITGTAPSTGQSVNLPAQSVTVLAVSPQFTITVLKPVQPSSVPAGSGGQGLISVNPINGYHTPDGEPGVTLSCSSITPLVTIPPICSFTYPSGQTSLPITSTGTNTSTITINTFGNVIVDSGAHPRTFYALWLPFPMLALVGLGTAVGGKRSRKAWGLLALFVIGGALFLMPACGNTTPTVSAPNGVVPNNTYTFTVTGVDAEGNSASNTGSSTSQNPSVTLTVTSPTT